MTPNCGPPSVTPKYGPPSVKPNCGNNKARSNSENNNERPNGSRPNSSPHSARPNSRANCGPPNCGLHSASLTWKHNNDGTPQPRPELQGQQRLDALRQAQLRQQADLVNLQTAQRQLDALRDAELDDQRREEAARLAEEKRQAKIDKAAQVQYDADQEGAANPQPTQISPKVGIDGDGFEEGAHGNAIIVGNYNPTPPPDPGRQDRIIRFFVFDTQDEPIPPGGASSDTAAVEHSCQLGDQTSRASRRFPPKNNLSQTQ